MAKRKRMRREKDAPKWLDKDKKSRAKEVKGTADEVHGKW